jgi:hypothetical protein
MSVFRVMCVIMVRIISMLMVLMVLFMSVMLVMHRFGLAWPFFQEKDDID